MKKERRLIAAFLGVLLLLTLVGAFVLQQLDGITVMIENKATSEIRDVRLAIAGEAYEIRSLAPGESRRVKMKVRGDGTLSVSFNDAGGSKSLSLPEYLTGGFAGSVHLWYDGAMHHRWVKEPGPAKLW